MPAQAIVGTSGLELALDDRLRGRPGGQLLAGDRVLASAVAKASPPVRTTISPGLQRVASEALGGQLGGVVALDPANGEILAVAGIGIDDLQPPGSTFKMVTLSAALGSESGQPEEPCSNTRRTRRSTASSSKTQTASRAEAAWRSPSRSRATRCSPRSASRSARRAWCGPLKISASTTRRAWTARWKAPFLRLHQIQGELDVGSTAIGQGEVQASALGDGHRGQHDRRWRTASPADVRSASLSQVSVRVRSAPPQPARSGA